MQKSISVTVPDIGDFKDVDIIEVLVAPGQTLEKGDSIITLESDKATMEVPAPNTGVVRELMVGVGSKVSKGTPILLLDVTEPATATSPPTQPTKSSPGLPSNRIPADIHAEVLVLGAGPGGYTAAFRAADLGKKVVLVERYGALGGVCLNVGCIPSKALLHIAHVVDQARDAVRWGVAFGQPRIDRTQLLAWKKSVVTRLAEGLKGLAARRKISVVQGVGRFVTPHALAVQQADTTKSISFEHAVIATGSRPIELPGFPHHDPRLLNSTSALELPQLDGELLIVGGGVIGLEMATIYASLGARITIVELSDGLLPGVDADLIKPLQKHIQARYAGIYFNTRVNHVESTAEGLLAYFQGEGVPPAHRYDLVLVAVGRRPNTDGIGIENCGVRVNETGFIEVDTRLRTNVDHIYAIGDVTGPPFLAHRASHQGRVAAEALAGMKSVYDVHALPSVCYTDPEIAWAGVTEIEAKQRHIDYKKATFPWSASGRALSLGRDEGLTKILVDTGSNRIIGVGMVGQNAGELIAEGVVAMEMGADAADISLCVHPHPTLSETLAFAAEAYEGTLTELYLPRR